MYPNLKLEIFKRGIRQNHLAKQLGIDETILSKIIHGHREPSAEQRRLLASHLDMEEAWLFEPYEMTRSESLQQSTQESYDGKNGNQ